jgi:hypothetical protein
MVLKAQALGLSSFRFRGRLTGSCFIQEEQVKLFADHLLHIFSSGPHHRSTLALSRSTSHKKGVDHPGLRETC